MNQQQNKLSEVLDESRPANIRRRQWRMFKDGLARYSVSVGGVGVVVAITLIFFYLAYVVVPLFKSAEVYREAEYPVPGQVAERTLHLAMEEQAEIGVRFTQNGSVTFFRTRDGEVLQLVRLGGGDYRLSHGGCQVDARVLSAAGAPEALGETRGE